MSTKPQPWDTEKAFSSGISFKPGRVYGRARDYGLSLTPQQGVSDVVCAALNEYLASRGWAPGMEQGVTPAEAEAIAAARRAGIDPVDVLLSATESRLGSEPVGHSPGAVCQSSARA